MTGNANSINAVQRQMFNPSQVLARSYANQAMMDGDDTFMGMGPIGGAAFMNSNSSIFDNSIYGNFGAGAAMGMGAGMGFGCYPGMMGMGWGPGSEIYTKNMTQKDYINYQKELNNLQLDNQVERKHKLAQTEFRSNASENAVSEQIGVVQRKVHENEQDHVMKEYNRLDSVARAQLAEQGVTNPTQSQISAYKQKLYFEATGKNIINDLAEHGDSSFSHGMKQGVLCGLGSFFANEKDYEDNISSITGEAKSTTAETWQKVGFGTSAVLTTGAVIAARRPIVKGLAYIAKALFKGLR